VVATPWIRAGNGCRTDLNTADGHEFITALSTMERQVVFSQAFH
jgi:hypothetical protein